MARIYPLFSSSKGNCTYFGDSENGIMIDCGVTCKRACDALKENSIPLEAVKAIFVTHTHSDHIKGLNVLLKKIHVPLYAQQINIDILREGKIPENTECIPSDGMEFDISGFHVSSFVTPHDSPASCGYRVRYPDGKIAVLCTDLGKVTADVKKSLAGADIALIEANYDTYMLRHGSYSLDLQNRIASNHGHLSNDASAKAVKMMFENGTRHFILGHLSEENNTPETAEKTVISALLPNVHNRDYTLFAASPSGGKAVIF